MAAILEVAMEAILAAMMQASAFRRGQKSILGLIWIDPRQATVMFVEVVAFNVLDSGAWV